MNDARQPTVRQSIRAALLEGPATCRDLSKLVGIPERRVPEELEHLERTLRAHGEELVVKPSVCRSCAFVFGDRERHRFKRSGRCPGYHGTRITFPEFFIER
jgi:predicted Zn-ribbon and HTH transcriptional regulator